MREPPHLRSDAPTPVLTPPLGLRTSFLTPLPPSSSRKDGISGVANTYTI